MSQHRERGAWRGDAAARADAQGVPADRARPEQHRDRLRAAGRAAAAVRLRRVARRRTRAGRAGGRSARRRTPPASSPRLPAARAISLRVPCRAICARRSRRCWLASVDGIVHLRPTSPRQLRQRRRRAHPGDRQRRRRQHRAARPRATSRASWRNWLAAPGRRPGRELPMPGRAASRASGSTASCGAATSWCPGLVAIIMTLIGALLTALVMAREWERGTMEALMVTPVTHERDPARQAGALFRARHGRHAALGGHGGVAVRGAAARLALAAVRAARRSSCWRRWAWAC